MELFETNKYYIVVNGTVALFSDRLSGEISFEKSLELPYEWNPVCLGKIKGIIGKINFVSDGESKLIVINKLEHVGLFPVFGNIDRVTKINIIPINIQSIANLDIDLCTQHHFGIMKTEKIASSQDAPKPIFKAFQDHMKSAAESVKPKLKHVRDNEKFEKRMIEEFEKMFHDSPDSTDCFYISNDPNVSRDITSNVQRQNSSAYLVTEPLWRRAHDRFFWNRTLLKDAIDSAEVLLTQTFGKCIFLTNNELSPSDSVLARTMIRDIEGILVPIIEGFVQAEPYKLNIPNHSPISVNAPNLPKIDVKHEYHLKVALISRRNRHRAGTRFRRRGVDCDGNVANYVETEQILQVDNDKSQHIVSFVQIRGSVPVFWSQLSWKYRPPIILEKSDEENQTAFRKHFATEFGLYDKVVIVNLVDTGVERSERKLSDAYLRNLIKLNSPMITCVLFDFHDYCSGLQFDNVSILIKGVTEIFRDMKYTWVDKNGMICEQKSVFRVNCVDCLDRTNVVQCMLAGVVIETQLRKLGLLSPEESLPNDFHQIILFMWANNGDAISRQYSGTAAMKGDFTRTGTRTMNGLVKDGVSSVSRYYLRLKEMSRQAALDLMTGNGNSAEIMSLRNGRSDNEQKLLKQKEENIKELAAQCKQACLKCDEECLAECMLIYLEEKEKESHDMNAMVLITSKMLYLIRIEFQQKRQPVAVGFSLQCIHKIQIGYESTLFRSIQPTMRIFYHPSKGKSRKLPKNQSKSGLMTDKIKNSLDEGCYLSFKQPSLRLFNNLLIEVKNHSDRLESLKAIAESLYLAVLFHNPNVEFDHTLTKFEKVKCKKLPKEWIFPIDINAIYKNIILSSLFTELHNDHAEMVRISDDVSDELETNINIQLTEYNTLKDKEVSKPFDMIRYGISKVKDKVKISEWKHRFTSLTNKNPPIERSVRGLNDERNEVNGILYNIDYQDCTQNDHQYPLSFWNDSNLFIPTNEDCWISLSDDELARRVSSHFCHFSVKKVKSDLNKYVHYDSVLESEQKTRSYNVISKQNMLNDKTNYDKDVEIEDLHSCVLSKKPIFSSYNDIKQLYMNSETISNHLVEEIVLASCGILNSVSDAFTLQKSKFLYVSINPQLVAATGGAYKRRAERISLQLSVDDPSPNEPWFLDSIDTSSMLTKRPKSRKNYHKESMTHSLSAPRLDYTDDLIDSSPVHIETMDLISYITMPPIDIPNARMVERLTQKQLQLAFFVESLKKTILDPNQSFQSKMIIF